MTKVNLKELTLDRVLIEPEEFEQKSPGGIIIPPTVDRDILTGKILMVGPDCTQVKAGDRIKLNKMAAEKITIDDKDLIITRETALIVVIND